MKDQSRINKLLLFFGFTSFSIGLIIAYTNPATGYEYSVYTFTPTLYWVGVGLSLVLAVAVIILATDKLLYKSGIVLSGLSMLSIVSLPLIRGFYYKGEGDALSHLGSTRDLSQGLIEPFEMIYPAVHLLGAISHMITDIPPNHTLLLLVALFVLAYFVFIPLSTRTILPDRYVVIVALFSGFFLLPVNHNSGGMFIHPTSQAHMFAPVLLFLLVLFYKSSDYRHLVLFLTGASMYTILHPQQAANFVVLLAVIFLIHSITQGTRNARIPIEGKVTSALVGFSVIYWMWIRNQPRFESHLTGRVQNILVETQLAVPTRGRAESLEAVGGSLLEVFLKLFFVPLVFVVVTGLLLLATLFHLLGSRRPLALQKVLAPQSSFERNILVFFGGGLVALFGMFSIYFQHGTTSDQYFRHYAFMMVLVTIMGAIAIGKIFSYLNSSRNGSFTVPAVLILALLFLSIPVVFQSPYFYQTSDHVTEAQVEGHELAFEYGDTSMEYDFVRSRMTRYSSAIEGTEASPRTYGDGVPDHFAERSLHEYYDTDAYLGVTEADRIQYPVVWHGFRFTHDDFEYLEAEPGINKVISNQGFELYQIGYRD